MKNQLLYPMATYILYMWFLALYMFSSRVKAIRGDRKLLHYFKNYVGDLLPERTIIIGRHYDNQFQVPILFFMTCLVYISLGATDTTTVYLAWFFVISRFLHAWVHLGSNNIRRRVIFFAMGWLTIVFMWLRLFI